MPETKKEEMGQEASTIKSNQAGQKQNISTERPIELENKALWAPTTEEATVPELKPITTVEEAPKPEVEPKTEPLITSAPAEPKIESVAQMKEDEPERKVNRTFTMFASGVLIGALITSFFL